MSYGIKLALALAEEAQEFLIPETWEQCVSQSFDRKRITIAHVERANLDTFCQAMLSAAEMRIESAESSAERKACQGHMYALIATIRNMMQKDSTLDMPFTLSYMKA